MDEIKIVSLNQRRKPTPQEEAEKAYKDQYERQNTINSRRYMWEMVAMDYLRRGKDPHEHETEINMQCDSILILSRKYAEAL